MVPRKQSGPAGTGRGRKLHVRRKPTTQHSPGSGQQARAGEPHAVLVLRLLAGVEDRFVAAVGLTSDQASKHPLPLGALRSAGLVVVLREPDLARDPEQLAVKVGSLVSALLEVGDVSAG